MIKIDNMYNMAAILMEFDCDTMSNSFVGNEFEVLDLLGAFNECVDISPDIIQFDSEKEGYYVFTVDRIKSDVVYSILPAVNDKTGKFYGVNGNIFVSTSVPENFEEDVKSYPHISVDTIIRVSVWDNDEDEDDCDTCPYKREAKAEIYTNKSDEGITQSWTDGKGSYFSRSYYSSDKDTMDRVVREWNDFAKKLNNNS